MRVYGPVADRGVEAAVHGPRGQRPGHVIAAHANLAHDPIGQDRNAATRCHQQPNHRRQLDLPDRGRLHPGRRQKLTEDVEAGALDRIGDQRLAGKAGGLDEKLGGKRMRGGRCDGETGAWCGSLFAAFIALAQEAGGMPPSHLVPSTPLPSGRHLSFEEREEIALLRGRGYVVGEIVRHLD